MGAKLEELQKPLREQEAYTEFASRDPFAFLGEAVLDPALLASVQEQARRHGVQVRDLIFSQNLLTQKEYVEQLARHNGALSLSRNHQLDGYLVDRFGGLERLPKGLFGDQAGMVTLWRKGQQYLALDVLHYDETVLALFLAGGSGSNSHLLLVTPDEMQALRARENTSSHLYQAIHGLGDNYKDLSARDQTTYPQILVFAFFFGLLGGGMLLAPFATLYALGGVLNLLFLYSVLLRIAAVWAIPLLPGEKPQTGSLIPDEKLPVYTILVPLFREQKIVGQLIENLLALDYPEDRLDIKLIFEQEDEETLRAARACASCAHFEFVIVPKASPQTKPKALNYALASARGDYVVVYDAEDRPQKDQLRKAVAAFRAGDADLACLQAGLNHYNIDENWLARQFTIEYTSLFDGLLPALQRLGLPIPLGGTSNHFRTELLRKIGGWDAFNVTEDADLGIRLVRFGYRCEMLPSTTYEEACCRPRDWVRQRTRWLKGWLQTYLVHMRHPVMLFNQLGARGFAGFQIILGAQVLSLIAHPIFIAFMIYGAFLGVLFDRPQGIFGLFFWTLAVGNFVFGYGVAIWLGFVTAKRRGLGRLYWQLPLMPFYWLLISFAAFRALIHYVIRPFFWEKTEHGVCKPCDNPKS